MHKQWIPGALLPIYQERLGTRLREMWFVDFIMYKDRSWCLF